MTRIILIAYILILFCSVSFEERRSLGHAAYAKWHAENKDDLVAIGKILDYVTALPADEAPMENKKQLQSRLVSIMDKFTSTVSPICVMSQQWLTPF